MQLEILLLLLSPAVGSFLGVLVDRLPRGQSILTPSRCVSCDTRLRPRDLFPILSALLARGRCRHCGARIPGHLLRIELAALIGGVAAVWLADTPMQMLLLAGWLWCLIALFYTDLLWFRLPDPLTGALFGLGLALAILDPSRGWADGALSAAIGTGAFLLIRWGYQAARRREGLGLGDVKLMAGIGAALGWPLLPYVTLLAGGLALTVVALEMLRDGKRPDGAARLPFGSYLCAAAALIAVIPT